MWQKDFWPLANEYLDLGLSLIKRKVFYPSAGILLFSVLQSDTSPKPIEKRQDIPVIQPMPYRYHDWLILPPWSHDE